MYVCQKVRGKISVNMLYMWMVTTVGQIRDLIRDLTVCKCRFFPTGSSERCLTDHERKKARTCERSQRLTTHRTLLIASLFGAKLAVACASRLINFVRVDHRKRSKRPRCGHHPPCDTVVISAGQTSQKDLINYDSYAPPRGQSSDTSSMRITRASLWTERMRGRSALPRGRAVLNCSALILYVVMVSKRLLRVLGPLQLHSSGWNRE